jgi:uncharacterized protein YciI
MRFVTIFSHGPQWQPGKSVYEQGPVIDDHLIAMRHRFDEGTLVLGGPFDGGTGGVAVLEAPDVSAARDVIESDPAVRAGVLDYRIHRLHAYFDALASTRTAGTVADLASERRGQTVRAPGHASPAESTGAP